MILNETEVSNKFHFIIFVGEFKPYPHFTIRGDFCCPGNSFTPEPVRWNQPPHPSSSDKAQDFIDGNYNIKQNTILMSIFILVTYFDNVNVYTYSIPPRHCNNCWYRKSNEC